MSLEFPRQEYWSGYPSPSPGESFLPRDWTWVFHIVGRLLTIWAMREAWVTSGKKPILNQRRVAKPNSIRLRGALSLESPQDAALDQLPGKGCRNRATPGAGSFPEGCRTATPQCLFWVAFQYFENPCRTSKLLYFKFRDIYTWGSFIIKYPMYLEQNHNIITRSLTWLMTIITERSACPAGQSFLWCFAWYVFSC